MPEESCKQGNLEWSEQFFEKKKEIHCDSQKKSGEPKRISKSNLARYNRKTSR